MIIDQFEFSGGHVKATTPAKPGEVIELNLPAIKLSGIDGHSMAKSKI